MKGLKKKRRIQLIAVAFVTLALASTLIGYAMRDAISFFRTPSQVVESPPSESEVFRIGGLVEDQSLIRGQGQDITFRVTDTNEAVEVVYSGILPDLFEEGQGVVATGTMRDGVFVAKEILAKHDENYIPKEVVDTLKEQGVYQPSS